MMNPGRKAGSLKEKGAEFVHPFFCSSSCYHMIFPFVFFLSFSVAYFRFSLSWLFCSVERELIVTTEGLALVGKKR